MEHVTVTSQLNVLSRIFFQLQYTQYTFGNFGFQKFKIENRFMVGIYCKTRIFSVDKFSSKHCQRAFATTIFRECVTVKNINQSNNIKMFLEMQLPHEYKVTIPSYR